MSNASEMTKGFEAFYPASLWGEAHNSLQNCFQGHSSVRLTIILSAIAFESSINELALRADFFRFEHPTIDRLASVLKDLDEAKTPIRTTVQLAFFALTQENISTGKAPYQDFDMLIRMRNELVHMRPTKFGPNGVSQDNPPHKFLVYLQSRKLITLNPKVDNSIWEMRVQEFPAVAQWAFDTASYMFMSLVKNLPNGETKKHTVRRFKNWIKSDGDGRRGQGEATPD